MKAKLSLSFLLTFTFYLLSSQVPQGFNYQAIARDGAGNAIPGEKLGVMLSIQADTSGSPVILWEELHSPVFTNSYGLFTVILGKGVKQSGSAAAFSDINWAVPQLFIVTRIYFKSVWNYMGSAKLWSVPYSMISGNLSGPLKKLSVAGETIFPDSALFEVKNRTGQTVFAVYNEGVRVYVDDGIAKGSTKGGFAIGGFGTGKASSQEYFRVTRDSTRVYVNPLAKGTKGGFAIGGFGTGKAGGDDFLNLTVNNYLIGHQSGKYITTGLYNSFMGYQAGMSTIDGSKNVFLGYKSGMSNTAGSDNVFIGDSVGVSNVWGNKNVFLGNYAGMRNVGGENNIYIGYKAGYLGDYSGQNICIGNYTGYNSRSSQNLFIGEYAGEKNTFGYRNSFVGFFAGQENLTGNVNSYFGQFAGANNQKSFNTFIGYWAGGLNVNGEQNVFLGYRSGQGSAGSNNVFLGYQAGEGNTGTGNVLIGYQAGYYSAGISNSLFIANSLTSTPLIGGDFAAGRVGINHIPTTYTLEVGGTIWANGASITAGASTWSDARFKTNISPINDALSGICNLRGVTYDWDETNSSTLNFPKGRQIGVIAQEVEKIFPELVITGNDGYKSVSYEKMSAVFIEGFKLQQKQIERQQKEIEELKSLVNSLITNQPGRENK
jgi:hypothetical protein